MTRYAMSLHQVWNLFIRYLEIISLF
jgi:hypothetical protein